VQFGWWFTDVSRTTYSFHIHSYSEHEARILRRNFANTVRKQHGVTTRKACILNLTAVRTSRLILSDPLEQSANYVLSDPLEQSANYVLSDPLEQRANYVYKR
jgi:hypothetical protein